MVLSILILIALILALVSSIGFLMLLNKRGFKYTLKFIYIQDEDFAGFCFIMQLVLFIVFFISAAATYNTFIDTHNPHYYKNDPQYIKEHK